MMHTLLQNCLAKYVIWNWLDMPWAIKSKSYLLYIVLEFCVVSIIKYFASFFVIRWTISKPHTSNLKFTISILSHFFLVLILEIKPCGLGSRIWDMEADLIYWWTFLTFMEAVIMLEAKHHTVTTHFGTVGWTEHWVIVPKCAVAVWCLVSNSLHGGQKCSPINEISLHISNSRTKPAGLDF